MRLWRISRHADLSGEGGRLAEGRWNRRGRPAVYLAEHPALALLETLVHLEIDAEDVPTNFRVLAVDVPDELRFAGWLEAELDSLHPDWRENSQTTRLLGEEFFERLEHVLLRVPSLLIPEACNFLLNPGHPDAVRLRIVSDEPLEFDQGLLRR
jgi:RES domain-containing protein